MKAKFLLILSLLVAGCDRYSRPETTLHHTHRITIYRGDGLPDRFEANVLQWNAGSVDYADPSTGKTVRLYGSFKVEDL